MVCPPLMPATSTTALSLPGVPSGAAPTYGSSLRHPASAQPLFPFEMLPPLTTWVRRQPFSFFPHRSMVARIPECLATLPIKLLFLLRLYQGSPCFPCSEIHSSSPSLNRPNPKSLPIKESLQSGPPSSLSLSSPTLLFVVFRDLGPTIHTFSDYF